MYAKYCNTEPKKSTCGMTAQLLPGQSIKSMNKHASLGMFVSCRNIGIEAARSDVPSQVHFAGGACQNIYFLSAIPHRRLGIASPQMLLAPSERGYSSFAGFPRGVFFLLFNQGLHPMLRGPFSCEKRPPPSLC